ncbi:hypothetical protein [Cellulosilyticum sp. I15G10I2]|uniref:hypothetical protein n=1 Tax=Cellulosilyticum sp. I15G10I2 TaxID=1892843 RepID=UPI00085C5A55|nr:hypothetical protein [Cellulosilyticum sp. I15G10I2]
MKTKIKVILLTAVLAVTTLYASDNGPGTSNDPLVTKSYVDKRIADLGAGGSTSNDVNKQLQAQQLLINELSSQIKLLQQESNTYEVVSVPQGKSILGKQGSEIIIRAGEAKVIGSEAGGIQDMTAGVDVNANSIAPRYHLLIIPREDGRGLIATKDLTVMVRGGYTIQ